MKYLVAVLLCLVMMSPASAVGMQDKKVIEYGWDRPNTVYVREHIKEMEKYAFDGLVICVTSTDATVSNKELGLRVFSKEAFKDNEIEPPIADLKATKFKRFTDNFLQMTVLPGNVDWFDSEWSIIAHNAGYMAKIAKLGGCKGIMFDPEIYGGRLWDYKSFSDELKAKHSYEEYAAQVKERGKEFIRAINKEYPDITMLCLYASSLPYMQRSSAGFENVEYGLLKSFFDGVYEAAANKTIIVDGFEFAYGYRERKNFANARRMISSEVKRIVDNPKEYSEHIQVGFGLWMDNNSTTEGWDQVDFSKNYFSPAGFRASLNYALNMTDKYVWIYSQKPWFWRNEDKKHLDPPQAYVDALADAKNGPGPGESSPRAYGFKAASIPGYADSYAFAEMNKTMTEIMDLPKDGWKWSRDLVNGGSRWGYNKPDFNDSKWRSISIGKFWEEQGEDDYDGYAWYRLRFDAPKIDPGKRVFLAVGAADDAAWVWMNGELVGKQDLGPGGWVVPFALDVTDYIKSDTSNLLAIKISDQMGVGGLWKSIKLMVK